MCDGNIFITLTPANMRRWPNVGLLLVQRRRRWANSKPTLGQRLIFAGTAPCIQPAITKKNNWSHLENKFNPSGAGTVFKISVFKGQIRKTEKRL